jgi:hypothetical protein
MGLFDWSIYELKDNIENGEGSEVSTQRIKDWFHYKPHNVSSNSSGGSKLTLCKYKKSCKNKKTHKNKKTNIQKQSRKQKIKNIYKNSILYNI